MLFYPIISPLKKHAGCSLPGDGVDYAEWLIWQMSCLSGKVSHSRIIVLPCFRAKDIIKLYASTKISILTETLSCISWDTLSGW